jgi:ubiquinone/menaquinone biosynthesis C-methylase UbiE
MKTNATRFSDRVADYIQYRPHYPIEFLDILKTEIGFDSTKIIADIGSGTGISSELFIDNRNTVYAVEPNLEMREAAEEIFVSNSNFNSINGSAEQTNLESNSIDLIVCAQAFHWFNKELSKLEFNRILKPDGHICMIWNERSTASEFQKSYEEILFESITEYKNVNHKNIDIKILEEFYFPRKLKKFKLLNHQLFELAGLKGRLMSSSYCPKQGYEYDNLMQRIENLFSQYKENGKVKFEYETRVYLG